MDYIQKLRIAIETLRNTAPTFPLEKHESLAQEEVIFFLRSIWASLPNGRLKDSEKEEFIKNIISVTPSEEHVALSSRGVRKRKLTEDERIIIEERQNCRCALCGASLDRSADPHVDHVIPISLGGFDEMSNFQLLCRKCNLGKGNSLHWLMIAPFFDEASGNEPSSRMRYCVLQRHAGACGIGGCSSSSSNSTLHVVQKIPLQAGGRNIFDNLTVVCEEHRVEYIKSQQAIARSRMKVTKSGLKTGFKFG